ncbi:MAG: hypothetical protein KJO08_03915 [Gammaproteobacteria bacterium]|nr:hypothetical protein [Gammaproteobacteria bacterium]NNJ84657.1 hypothetical protein [Gammaproteobacteria bacterium]
MKQNFQIESDRLLAVEGRDEYNFFDSILKHIGIKDVQLVDIGGKDKFKTEFPALYNLPGFPRVRFLGFIRDAEDKKAYAAFSSICSILKKYSLPKPEAINEPIDGKNNDGQAIRISIFIMPNNLDRGMLEDLCLESVSEKPVFGCVNQYVECCLSTLPESEESTNNSKAKVQTYLAVQKDIANSLGTGAQKGYWDFEHDCFDNIKRFLQILFD